MILRIRRLTAIVIPLYFLVAFPPSAYGDNCGSLSDCYGTVFAGVIALIAIAAILALVFIVLPEIMPFLLEGAEVAEIGETAVAAEAIGTEAAGTQAVATESEIINSAIQEAITSGKPAAQLEGKVAQAIKDSGIDVTGFNRPIGPNASIGQIDIETRNAIIEVTTSRSGKLAQIVKLSTNATINPSVKQIILYAPNYNNTAAKAIIDAGAYVVRSASELLSVLGRLGGG